ncbi:MAG: DUF481 domain-containing protein [Phycisphaerales bacterium]|nr:DUF481 domain-containing protein [Phycisphaerales bacterium]
MTWTGAAGDSVTLTSGEQLQGAITNRNAEFITLEHHILGRLQIELSAITLVNGKEPSALPEQRGIEPTKPAPAASPLPPGSAVDAQIPTSESSAPPVPASLDDADDSDDSDDGPVVAAPVEQTLAILEEEPPKWHSQIEIGLNGSDGSSETANLRTTFKTSVATDTSTFRFDTTYRLATNRGDRTENRFTAGTFNEWRQLESRWTAFVQTRLDSDEFQPWDARLTGSGGFGYVLYDVQKEREDGLSDDIFKLTARGGAGVRREFGSEDDDIAPEGLVGAEFQYALNDHVHLGGGSTLFPDFRESGDFRVVSNLDLTIDLTRFDGVHLKFGVANEYETLDDPSFDQSDFSAYATLVVKF